VKLLRAIQERAVRRVGGTAEEPVDVRLVSATHKKLDDLVAQGHFRQDLFYRLSVIPVHMPALREIRPDVPMIATALLHKLARGSAPHALTAAAQAALARYDFPGNVRELENLLERALALAGKPGVVDAADLFLAPIDVADHEPDAIATNDVSDIQAQVVDESSEQPVTRGNLPLQDFLDSVERTALAQALAQAKGNRTRAAQALGITFRSIRYRLERLGMERPD
jgi:two-component system, NtrC family, response regulator PilR